MRNLLLVGAALIAGLSASANAYVTVHVEHSPATQAEIAPDAFSEDFGGATANEYTSSFGGSAIRAVFSGFGVANGASTLGAGQATIKLDRMVKYFGYRPDSLDGNNTVELFSKGKSLGYFNLVDTPEKAGAVSTALGSGLELMRTGGAFTYVNFFSDVAFDEIRFTQSAGNLSLDDVRVANVSAVPDVGTWGLLILGFGAVGAALRSRRVKGVRFA